jgi:phage tail-like protein
MARPVNTDFFQLFRFHIVALTDSLTEELAKNINTVPEYPDAGFMNVTMPEMSQGVAEIRDGITIFTKKQPGIPTFNDLTLSRGLTRRDIGLYKWMLTAITGGQYRIDLAIYQFHRTDIVQPADKRSPSRKIIIKDAFPMRFKPGGDLDASSEDISIVELDIAYENFYIITPDGSFGNDII